MGNSAEAPYAITTPGTYYDVTPRVLRNIISYPFNGTFTSTITLAAANSIPQITQGNEVMAFNYTAQSLSSMLEFEVFTNILNTNGSTIYWMALFADYTPDALLVIPGGNNLGSSLQLLVNHYAKHYMMPVSLNPIRYSLRMVASQGQIIVNYYQFGGRTQSRVTVKEWSGLSLTNTP
jgi:hypothetical protein